MLKSPFSSRKPQDFRVLLFYPNLHMSALMPQVIGIFTALFKKEGYTLDLFDCTHYEDINDINMGKNTNEEKVKHRISREYSNEEWIKKGGKPKWGIKNDFVKKVQDFKPDLILVSVLESTYNLSIELLKAVPQKDRNYKTLFGGVFATYATNKVINSGYADYVCRGEGEDAIIEMCRKLCNGDRIDNIANFTIRGNDQIYRRRKSI